MSELLVFGSINLDVSLRVPRLPALGETLMGCGLRINPGGKGANQAHAASLYGAAVQMVGAVGNDDAAHSALVQLERAGVGLSGVRRLDTEPTGVATIHVTDAGDNAIVVAAGANRWLRADWVADSTLDSSRMLLLQLEVPASESMALARRMRARGGQVMLNLAPARSLSQLDPQCLDWLVLNQTELDMLCLCLHLATREPAEAVRSLARAWRCSVVVTLGEAGALACLADGTAIPVPAHPAPVVVDTTGAGDTFCGVLAAALLAGQPAAAALRCASVAASLACSRVGAQAAQPTRHEIDRALADADGLAGR